MLNKIKTKKMKWVIGASAGLGLFAVAAGASVACSPTANANGNSGTGGTSQNSGSTPGGNTTNPGGSTANPGGSGSSTSNDVGQKFFVTKFNTLGNTLTFGISPDYVQDFQTTTLSSNPNNAKVPEYLVPYTDFDNIDFVNDDLSTATGAQIAALNVYAFTSNAEDDAPSQLKKLTDYIQAHPQDTNSYVFNVPQGYKFVEGDNSTNIPFTGTTNALNPTATPAKQSAVVNAQKRSLIVSRFNDSPVTNVSAAVEKGFIKHTIIASRGGIPELEYQFPYQNGGIRVWDVEAGKALTPQQVSATNQPGNDLFDNSSFGADGNEFYPDFTSPYITNISFAQSLTFSGYNFNDFPQLKQKFNGQATSFVDYAKRVNRAISDTVRRIANLQQFQDIRSQNQTALFITLPQLNTATLTSSDTSVNNLYAEQPLLHPTYYGDKDNPLLPGLGFSFPAPLKNSNGTGTLAGQKVSTVPFDNFFEIGSAFNNEEGSPKTGENLAQNFAGQNNYVFVFYDNNNVPQATIDELFKQVRIWNKTAEMAPDQRTGMPGADLDIVKMLKQGGHIIPLNKNISYVSTWDPIGALTQIKSITEAINEFTVDDETVRAANQKLIEQAYNASEWLPFQTSQLQRARPPQNTTATATTQSAIVKVNYSRSVNAVTTAR